jgi:hypothetical protein
MKNKILMLALATLSSFFSYGQSSTRTAVVLKDRLHLQDSFLQVAKIYLKVCNASWHLTYDTIILENMKKSPDYPYLGQLTPASTIRNVIYLSTEYLEKMNVLTFKNILKHQFFSTLDGRFEALDPTFTLINPPNNEKMKLIGFSGLSLIFEDVRADYFAKASAEYCSWLIDFERLDTKYNSIAYLVSRSVDSGWITIDDMIRSTKESNPFLFCSKLLNKKVVSILDVVNLSILFDQTSLANSDPVAIFNQIAIARMRNE